MAYIIEWTDNTGEIGYCELVWNKQEYLIALEVAKVMDNRNDGYSHRVVELTEGILNKLGKK